MVLLRSTHVTLNRMNLGMEWEPMFDYIDVWFYNNK